MSGDRETLSRLLYPLVARMHLGYCWKKTQDGPRRIDVQFTNVLLSEHVMGGSAYGLCPIAPGTNTCRVACLDLDSHKGEVEFTAMRSYADEIAMALELDGMHPHLFRSSGGAGIHIYLTWAEPQDAYSVRVALRSALALCNLKSGTKGVARGEVEIFPKQDAVPGDGYGSMFILPWTGASAPLGVFHAWVDSAAVPVREREERSADRAATQALPAVARLKSALDAIPNSGTEELSYDEWRNIIFALHAATEGSDTGLDLAHEFSSRSSKYDSDFLNNRVWPYIRTDRDGPSITEGTLFAAASGVGWTDPTAIDDFDVVAPSEPADGSPAQVAPRFTFVHESQFAEGVMPEMIVQDIIPDADLVVVYGEPGSGKSFWTLDLVQAVCRGISWQGKRVQQHRCAYIAAEGSGGFRKRINAYKREHQLDSTDLFVLADAPNFLEAAHVKDVIKRLRDVGSPKLVVIDTLAQVAAGGAENSSEDMGKIILHCRMVSKHTGATVILIHHSGKDASRGARGHSSLKGAMDTEIEIVRVEHDRIATITKQKDGEDGMEFGFKLRQVHLGENAHGDAINSCVVDHGAAVARDRRKSGPKGVNEKIVWQAAIDLQALDGTAPTTSQVIDTAITKMLYDNAPDGNGKVPRDLRRQNALKALTTLRERGTVRDEDGRIYVVEGAAAPAGSDLT